MTIQQLIAADIAERVAASRPIRARILALTDAQIIALLDVTPAEIKAIDAVMGDEDQILASLPHVGQIMRAIAADAGDTQSVFRARVFAVADAARPESYEVIDQAGNVLDALDGYTTTIILPDVFSRGEIATLRAPVVRILGGL